LSKNNAKKELKSLMSEIGISYQTVADHSGVGKADVSRILNYEMEENVISTICNLIKERKKKVDLTLGRFNNE
jgi:hypothetical protein